MYSFYLLGHNLKTIIYVQLLKLTYFLDNETNIILKYGALNIG